MKGKIIQIVISPESKYLRNSLWALTDEGRIYFMPLYEGVWYEQELPSEKIQLQPTAKKKL